MTIYFDYDFAMVQQSYCMPELYFYTLILLLICSTHAYIETHTHQNAKLEIQYFFSLTRPVHLLLVKSAFLYVHYYDYYVVYVGLATCMHASSISIAIIELFFLSLSSD